LMALVRFIEEGVFLNDAAHLSGKAPLTI